MRLAALAAGSALLLPTLAHADVTYYYVGQPIALHLPVDADPYPNPLPGSVTGSFTVADPLPANMAMGPFDPISAVLRDNTLTLSDVRYSDFFAQTDAFGNLVGWEIELGTPTFSAYIGLGREAASGSGGDTALQYNVYAYNSTPGTWSMSSSTATPEPGSLALLGSGAFGLVGLLRRSRRRPADAAR